ncbi:FAD/NAD(P)-binding domain-containing protein [Wilcoxina mikolae CBS 423.85]|nr:FAD/NAD(P)-binding domain-containing protein [Wilcoxina mikolae CBS 423.85]
MIILALPSKGWDYVIVGTGPAGLVLADRLSATGKRTLVLEAGTPSTYASGGREAPAWIKDSNEPLSRFDIPGFFGAFSAHPDGHQCPDTPLPILAGCLLGGGTAVNSGIFIFPPAEDWDRNFPTGWKSQDMMRATERARKRIPGTYNPSQDGKIWFPESFEVLGRMVKSMGWTEVAANQDVDWKNRAFSRTPFMNIRGERGGPMEGYLLKALPREGFEIWYGARVERVIRKRGMVSGVEFIKDGERQEVYLAEGGKVILSAGTFGSPKILWQSGIGTRDQLEIVRSAQELMVDEKEWINLPVGYNLMDHPATYAVFKYPGVGAAYNYSGAYNNPNHADAENYLKNRAGPLASSNARISIWEEIVGTDGVSRTIQWNGRTGTAGSITGPDLLLLTNYVTRGQTSRGRIGLNEKLNHTILSSPHLVTKEDTEALIISFKNLLAGVKNIEGLQLLQPDLGSTSIEEFVHNYNLPRGSNHWLGTAAMGSVVDTETKVKGMENLYVVDASIFPGMVSSNPVAAIVVLAEKASEIIIGRS